MLSVVIPIYNEEEIISILHHSVREVMNQIGEPWEVVYVNDGSQDSSLQLLRELQTTDPHVVDSDVQVSLQPAESEPCLPSQSHQYPPISATYFD